MGTVTAGPGKIPRAPGYRQLIDAIAALADALVDTAIVVGEQATWLSADLKWSSHDYVKIERTGDPSLYDGSAGIAWACAAVTSVLGRDDLGKLATRAINHATAFADRVESFGLYEGLAGIGLVALHIGDVMEDRKIAASGSRLLRQCANSDIEGSDLISGWSGLGLAFVRAAQITNDDYWRQAAERAGEELLARADRRPWGWSWPETANQSGLCGLAHGASGIAWVLSEISTLLETGRFKDAILGAIQYERSWFDPAHNNWPDLRTDKTGSAGDGGFKETDSRSKSLSFPAFWCHGAAGIGLARLAIYRKGNHASFAGEAAAALQATHTSAINYLISYDLPHGVSLCHGLGGQLDLLTEAYCTFGEVEHLHVAQALATQAFALLGNEVTRWPGGIRGIPSPGLMNGFAGALQVLTRLLYPNIVPSPGLLTVSPDCTSLPPKVV
jgi:lantibiotic modifying enzyme